MKENKPTNYVYVYVNIYYNNCTVNYLIIYLININVYI